MVSLSLGCLTAAKKPTVKQPAVQPVWTAEPDVELEFNPISLTGNAGVSIGLSDFLREFTARGLSIQTCGLAIDAGYFNLGYQRKLGDYRLTVGSQIGSSLYQFEPQLFNHILVVSDFENLSLKLGGYWTNKEMAGRQQFGLLGGVSTGSFSLNWVSNGQGIKGFTAKYNFKSTVLGAIRVSSP